MKDLKSFNNTEMGIDVNDIKILINAGFQYLTRTCHQWAKDHPLVSCVLLFFYLLYIFFPSLFSILFYTFPLVICTAILLGGSQITSEKKHNRDIIIKKQDDHKISKTANHNRYLQPQMSRRTFGKDKNKDDAILKENSIISDDMNHVKTSSFLDNVEKTRNVTRSNSQSDTESQDEDELPNKAVQWTEDDQRNLMDLGSSEIERNKRLESLIAKRRARKLLSMQPRRNKHIDYLGDYYNYYPNDHHLDSVGSIMVARGPGIDQHHQPGSAPSVLLPTRNPFDIPYDPHEEKPVLTGGSFEEEFFATATPLKDLLFSSSHETCSEAIKEDPVSKLLPSFFSNTKPVDKPGFSRFRRQSDAEESVKEITEELFQQGNDQTPDQVQESPQEVQFSQIQSDYHDQGTTLPLQEEESHKLEEDPFTQNNIEPKSDSVSTTESKNEEELVNQNNEEAKVNRDEDQRSVNKDNNDDGDESSSSSSCETSINASKNEAFRNSVKKVLTCLVKNKGFINPTTVIPTKMEERSFYTCQHRHTPTYSIASDIQVEVSEIGPPRSMPHDPSSPTTDQESMVYDGDVERDANSGDEDLWGASPHPIRSLGDFGNKFKLHDIIEEGSSNRGSEFEISHNAPDPIGEQAPERGANSSLSPRSILPEENRKELMDNKSTNGDIIEARSSVSSSSESVASQMMGKSEHLAEYLSNLAPSECGSNILEDPGPSHNRDTSAEEITIQDESNPIFEMDEDKEDSKESKEFEISQETSDQSSSTGQSESPKDASLASNGYILEDELNMDPKMGPKMDQAPFIAEQNQVSGILEVDSTPLEKAVTEEADTTCQEDVTDQSRSVEEQGVELEKDVEIKSENQVAGEVTVESSNNFIIQEASTSMEKDTGEANHDETSK